MLFSLPTFSKIKSKRLYEKSTAHAGLVFRFGHLLTEKTWSLITVFLATISLSLIALTGVTPVEKLIAPILNPLHSLTASKSSHEVFGFAPWWNMSKFDDVDYTTLTTFAYFGIPVNSDGTLEKNDPGYENFVSDKATEIFKKAHAHGTRVVLTVTQMDSDTIDLIMSDENAKEKAITEIVHTIKSRGIDGVNVDFEYIGDPGEATRNSFTHFISTLTTRMHEAVPNSQVTVSVYASSARGVKLYDIAAISKASDKIFMMAYDFAVAGSDYAIPTAPLYGFKEGKYSYDVSTAVEDFLKVMPADKLILGVPYYGYNYLVYNPEVNAETRPGYSWRGSPTAQTYSYVLAENGTPEKSGWDEIGKVGWKAYYNEDTDTWRMIFLDDERSLGIKYDYAKNMGLAGVGMWALGNDSGQESLWAVLRTKFGPNNLADSRQYTDIYNIDSN